MRSLWSVSKAERCQVRIDDAPELDYAVLIRLRLPEGFARAGRVSYTALERHIELVG